MKMKPTILRLTSSPSQYSDSMSILFSLFPGTRKPDSTLYSVAKNVLTILTISGYDEQTFRSS